MNGITLLVRWKHLFEGFVVRQANFGSNFLIVKGHLFLDLLARISHTRRGRINGRCLFENICLGHVPTRFGLCFGRGPAFRFGHRRFLRASLFGHFGHFNFGRDIFNHFEQILQGQTFVGISGFFYFLFQPTDEFWVRCQIVLFDNVHAGIVGRKDEVSQKYFVGIVHGNFFFLCSAQEIVRITFDFIQNASQTSTSGSRRGGGLVVVVVCHKGKALGGTERGKAMSRFGGQ